MRVTSQMITNNAMNALAQQQKVLNRADEQYNSQKKILRPSDDPTAAAKILKYRTQLAELGQFKGTNIPEAREWLEGTYDTLEGVNTQLLKMYSVFNQASNGILTAEDKESLVGALKECKEAIYGAGSADYNGRYLFSGARTEDNLIFEKEEKGRCYEMTETVSFSEMDQVEHVGNGTGESSTGGAGAAALANPPKIAVVNRLRLSYQKLDGAVSVDFKDKNGVGVVFQDGGGTAFTPAVVNKSSVDADRYAPGAQEIYYLPDTGELIMGSEVSACLQGQAGYSDCQVSVTYQKTGFEKNDLKPEHYMACKDITDPGNPVEYPGTRQQGVVYQIGYSQEMKVNVAGKDAIPAQIGRTIDDVVNQISEMNRAEQKLADTRRAQKDPANQAEAVQKDLALLEEKQQLEVDLCKDMLGRLLSSKMDVITGIQAGINGQMTEVSNKSQRLELTANRAEQQYQMVTASLSRVEDASIYDLVVDCTTAEQVYNSSLAAASKSIQKSLMDFIQ